MHFKTIAKFLLFAFSSLILNNVKGQRQIVVHFNYRSTVLSLESKKLIDSAIQCQQNENISIKLVGHTNKSPGKEIANQLLSLQRSTVVEDYLLNTLRCNITFDSIVGCGGDKPLVPNTTAQNKQLNRRVEITFSPKNPEIPQTDSSLETGYESGKLLFATLYKQLATPAEIFCINNTRDTLLVGKKGTIIHIKKGDLMPSSCSCVNISLTEYFDRSDMILNNLTTTSDGKQLESGGMIKIEATCNGKVVEMASGRRIGIMVPTDTVLPDMKIFEAVRDSSSDILNWSAKNNMSVDYMDYWRMYWHCMGMLGDGKVPKCPFFFCKIGRFFGGIFSQGKRKANMTDKLNNLANEERNLVKKYSFDTATLASALAKSKNNNKDIVKYYAFQNLGWGYRNVDRYKSGAKFENLYVSEKPRTNIDAKFVERLSKSIVPALEQSNNYVFKDLFANTAGWLVVIKLTENKIFLCLKEANSNDGKVSPDYQEVSIEELKHKVKVMDSKW